MQHLEPNVAVSMLARRTTINLIHLQITKSCALLEDMQLVNKIEEH